MPGSTTRAGFTHSTVREISILALSGEVDLGVRDDFDDAVTAAICEMQSALIVDLSAVTYLDLVALSVLYKAAEQLRRQNDRLYFVIPNDGMRMVFSISHLDRLYPVSESLEEALARAHEDALPAP